VSPLLRTCLALLCLPPLLAGCNSRENFYSASYKVACAAMPEAERAAEIRRVGEAVALDLGLPSKEGEPPAPFVEISLPIASAYRPGPGVLRVAFSRNPPLDFFDRPYEGYVIEIRRPPDGDGATTLRVLDSIERVLKRSSCTTWKFSSWSEKLG
jgi:hypothetical protein